MASDYTDIRIENERRYGTDIGRIGPMLLANRYADRTHFIFELLQNAEDALRRRESARGPRSVSFALKRDALQVSHFGQPFTEADVRGICGIGQSTKPGLTAIGRFGIGFKAVYAFTASPEVHSDDEHFAIDSYVWPRGIPPLSLHPKETIFRFPFRESDGAAFDEIADGLRNLGVRTLLFLKEIEEINWEVESGLGGIYLRSKGEAIAENAYRVTLMGQQRGGDMLEETWLLFSRDVRTRSGKAAGSVELAF